MSTDELTAPVLVPATVHDGPDAWDVRRAWPDRRGIAVEASCPDASHVRGGFLTPDGEITLHAAANDPRLPGLADHAGADGQVVSHRPGRRAVVRSGDGSTFVKVVRPGRGPELAAAVARSSALAAVFTTPRVVDSTDDALVLAAVPGQSLLSLATHADDPTWSRAWRDWSDAWTTAAAQAVDPTAPVHDAAAEARVVDSWLAKAGPLLGHDVVARLTPVAHRATAALLDGRPSRSAPAHRDLHDQQLLWSPGTVALLDVDTCATAEAALDLGNLRAHVRWRQLQGLYSADQAAVARAEVDRAVTGLDVSPARVAEHELATCVRLACVYAFRPPWRDLALTLVHHLAAADWDDA